MREIRSRQTLSRWPSRLGSALCSPPSNIADVAAARESGRLRASARHARTTQARAHLGCFLGAWMDGWRHRALGTAAMMTRAPRRRIHTSDPWREHERYTCTGISCLSIARAVGCDAVYCLLHIACLPAAADQGQIGCMPLRFTPPAAVAPCGIRHQPDGELIKIRLTIVPSTTLASTSTSMWSRRRRGCSSVCECCRMGALAPAPALSAEALSATTPTCTECALSVH